MKKIVTILLAFSITLFLSTSLFAQDSSKTQTKGKAGNKVEAKHGKGFVDANGDGYNDNAPDHDGDGIPNGLDEDYEGPGKMGFVDEDGDGINDNAGMKEKVTATEQNLEMPEPKHLVKVWECKDPEAVLDKDKVQPVKEILPKVNAKEEISRFQFIHPG